MPASTNKIKANQLDKFFSSETSKSTGSIKIILEIVIKFADVDTQLQSKTVLQQALLDRVIIALNLEPSTPKWLKDLGGNPVKLGLDLSGGVHFLLEVDIDTAQEGRLELLLDTYRRTFKEEKIKYDSSSIRDLSLYFQFSDKSSYNRALKKYRDDSLGISGVQYVITERPSTNTLFCLLYTSPSPRDS